MIVLVFGLKYKYNVSDQGSNYSPFSLLRILSARSSNRDFFCSGVGIISSGLKIFNRLTFDSHFLPLIQTTTSKYLNLNQRLNLHIDELIYILFNIDLYWSLPWRHCLRIWILGLIFIASNWLLYCIKNEGSVLVIYSAKVWFILFAVCILFETIFLHILDLLNYIKCAISCL